MRKYLIKSLMLSALLLVLTGSAYANPKWEGPTIWHDWDHYGGGKKECKVPEPASLALLGSGMAGIGLFNIIKRKSRK